MNSIPLKRTYIFILFLLINMPAIWCQKEYGIVDKTVDFGMRKAENRKISAVIIHSTYNNSGGEKYNIDLIIKQFHRYNVSSHYVIDREGIIYSLVNEKNISFQAGKSSLPDGTTAVNTCSIGIELMCTTEDSPTGEQLKSLLNLVKDIQSRYQIQYVLRHSDIAPGRKTDPWNMNWDDFLHDLAK
ncbi:MAG: N-acetylmuramoyl-L-alanine amidase [Paludibacter sp.]